MTENELIRAFQRMYKEGWAYVPGGASRGKVDCSGAFVYALGQAGLKMGRHGSNWMARREVEELIPAEKAEPGMAVFKTRSPDQGKYALPDRYRPGGADCTGDLLDYYHVGLADEDPAWVLNAQGTKAGFTRRPISENWSFAGRLKLLRRKEKTMTKTVLTPNGGILWLRKSPGGEKLAKIPCGASVEAGEEKEGWTAVTWEGREGWCDSRYLTEGGVKLLLPEDAARALLTALREGLEESHE